MLASSWIIHTTFYEVAHQSHFRTLWKQARASPPWFLDEKSINGRTVSKPVGARVLMFRKRTADDCGGSPARSGGPRVVCVTHGGSRAAVRARQFSMQRGRGEARDIRGESGPSLTPLYNSSPGKRGTSNPRWLPTQKEEGQPFHSDPPRIKGRSGRNRRKH